MDFLTSYTKNTANPAANQIGCAWCTVIELLQQHRKEVISIKDQLRFVKERLML